MGTAAISHYARLYVLYHRAWYIAMRRIASVYLNVDQVDIVAGITTKYVPLSMSTISISRCLSRHKSGCCYAV